MDLRPEGPFPCFYLPNRRTNWTLEKVKRAESSHLRLAFRRRLPIVT